MKFRSRLLLEKKNKSKSKSKRKKKIVEQNKELKMNMMLQWRIKTNEAKI